MALKGAYLRPLKYSACSIILQSLYYIRSPACFVLVWCRTENASPSGVVEAIVVAAEAYMAADLAINQAIGDYGAAAILSATKKR